MNKRFALICAIVIIGIIPIMAQVETRVVTRIRDGVARPTEHATALSERPERTSPKSPYALMGPNLSGMKKLKMNLFFIQYALTPMERPDLSAKTKFQFVFMVKGQKIELSEAGSSPMKPLGLAIKNKLQEANLLDETSNIKLAVNIYATEFWDDRGWINNDSRVHLEAGLVEDRKIFNNLIFSVRLKENDSPKNQPPSTIGMGLVGDRIGFEILGAEDFIPFAN